MSNILVIAAHPDDEVLGVGATVARHVENGDLVYCYILGEGQTSRWAKREDADVNKVISLHRSTLGSAAILGFHDVFFENYPDNRFDHLDLLDITKNIEKRVTELKPQIIYTHHYGDLNLDHRITFNATLTATRPLANCPVQEIYAFETLSSTEWNFSYGDACFKPNVFYDISPWFYKKIDAMKEYETELCEYPHPRSIKTIELNAQKWGSVVGRSFVEPFELIRKVH